MIIPVHTLSYTYYSAVLDIQYLMWHLYSDVCPFHCEEKFQYLCLWITLALLYIYRSVILLIWSCIYITTGNLIRDRDLKSKLNLKSIYLLTAYNTMRRFYLYYLISLVVFYIIYFLLIYPVLEKMYPGSLFLFLPVIIVFPFIGVSKNKDEN